MLEFVAVIYIGIGNSSDLGNVYIYIYIFYFTFNMTAENKYKALYIGRSIIFFNVNIRYVSKD